MKQRFCLNGCGALCALAVAVLAPRARAEAVTTQAAPPSNEQCAGAYEQGQELRKSGRLVEARDALRVCARDECPGFIHDDCLAWHGEVQAELPTLVFSATSGGRDLTDVTVQAGSRVLASRLDGEVVELDPGEYELVFTAPGLAPQRRHFVVARGERNRLVRVDLTPAETEASPEATLAPQRSLTVPAIFAGVGLVGIGGFVGLGAWGRSSESELSDGCAPQCVHDDVASVRTKYILADVSLGVGIAGLAVAAYTFFREPPATTSRSTSGVGVHASSSDVRFTYGGRF